MSQEDKARALVEKAEKKLASWSLFGGGSKYEDAAEMYTKAANLFKVSKCWNDAGACFEKTAQCALKSDSPHEAATAHTDAANCYKKTDAKGAPPTVHTSAPLVYPCRAAHPDSRRLPRRAAAAIEQYKEAIGIHIDLGRFPTAAKLQKEIAELHEGEGNLPLAMEAFQTAADYYQGEENTAQGNQCLLRVAGLASAAGDYQRAIDIYEQVGTAALESNLLKWSVKDYWLKAGICHLATGDGGAAASAVRRYNTMDASFEKTREGMLLENLTKAFGDADADAFTEHIRAYDEISRLSPEMTTLLLEVKNTIKAQVNDIT
mmetsp:Transcript_18538/g.54950  ORF Transcript_18538/g.54950 Transcript_18538/m.54950 type:complete len:319 (+) Transcript_18538:47-1003(+)